MLVDFHVHAFAEKIAARAIGQVAGKADLIPETDGTAEGLRRRLQEWGVDKGVVLPIATKPTQQTIINDWAAQQQDETLYCYGSVHPDAPDVLEELELSSPQELIEKCFGLSLSDQYWISPTDKPLDWHRVNFFENAFSEDIGNILFGKGTGSDSTSLVSPDNTANGNLKKKWKIIDGKRVLLKDSSAPYRQEAYNEVLASEIANRLGIPHVPYTLIAEHGEFCSGCEDFITPETDLVAAAQVMSAFKKRNEQSEYEFYIECCEKLGIADAREKLEQMLVLDYLIVNEDRHLNNFGLIRNAVTLEWVGVAPLYDNGNSMWFNRVVSEMHADDDSNIKTPLWKKNPTENLELVTDFSWLDLSALDGIEDFARELYEKSEYMEPIRVDTLANALRTRVDLLDDIVQTQSGGQIML